MRKIEQPSAHDERDHAEFSMALAELSETQQRQLRYAARYGAVAAASVGVLGGALFGTIAPLEDVRLLPVIGAVVFLVGSLLGWRARRKAAYDAHRAALKLWMKGRELGLGLRWDGTIDDGRFPVLTRTYVQLLGSSLQ